MIQVVCREETYIYNAYHMVKAFYPAQEVTSCVEEKASHYITVYKDGEEIVAVEEIPGTSEDAIEIDAGKKADIAETLRRKRKHAVDLALYDKLADCTGRTLAWGTLTGVRPTKLAMRAVEAGQEKEAFLADFGGEYRVSREKGELAWEIAGREKHLLDRLDLADGYSLYVGIPFCPTVCTYCSFSSGPLSDWKDSVETYVDALIKELTYLGKACEKKKLNAIYIGGGTPTTLSAGQLERLLSCIDNCFSREYLLEYTVEAGRPDSITEEKLRVLKEHQVTRISINPQTMQQKTLDRIGRRHSVQEVRDAVFLARELGFDNVNMDLIAGLPGESISDMEDTLAQIKELAPDSLTVHSLAVKRASKMGQKDSGEYRETIAGREDPGREHARISSMVQAAYAAAKEMGLVPYYLYRQKNIAGNFENVGYAKVDKAGIYNILIMEEKQSIIAAGAGASTKLVLKEEIAVPGNKKGKCTNLMRLENVKAIDAYIRRVDEMIERKGEWLWR